MIAKTARKPFYAAAESFKFVRMFPLNQYDLPSKPGSHSGTLSPSQYPTLSSSHLDFIFSYYSIYPLSCSCSSFSLSFSASLCHKENSKVLVVRVVSQSLNYCVLVFIWSIILCILFHIENFNVIVVRIVTQSIHFCVLVFIWCRC